jgi:hypothetical protein
MEPEIIDVKGDEIKVDEVKTKEEIIKEQAVVLKAEIEDAVRGNGQSSLGATKDSLKGIKLEEMTAVMSACNQMKWAYDNTGLRYKPYFKLDFEQPEIGLEIWSGAKLVETIAIPSTGGMDGDPTLQISRDMYTMIAMALKHANNNLI